MCLHKTRTFIWMMVLTFKFVSYFMFRNSAHKAKLFHFDMQMNAQTWGWQIKGQAGGPVMLHEAFIFLAWPWFGSICPFGGKHHCPIDTTFFSVITFSLWWNFSIEIAPPPSAVYKNSRQFFKAGEKKKFMTWIQCQCKSNLKSLHSGDFLHHPRWKEYL